MEKKLEFSKKIFIGVTIGVVLVTIFTCYMVWITQNLTPLIYLIPCVFTEFATATGFYFNKAREENKIKISNNKDLGC